MTIRYPTALPPEQIRLAIGHLADQLAGQLRYDIGFPGARDVDYEPLTGLLTRQRLNNIGDAWDGHDHMGTTHRFERDVLQIIAGWWNAPTGFWGYTTPGASEGTLHAVDEGMRRFYPDAPVVFFSREAHYCARKAVGLLKAQYVMIRTGPDGAMDLNDLWEQLGRHRSQPVIVIATAGTTKSEAIDDVAQIVKILHDLAIDRYRIHVDAALSGVPLALLAEADRPEFDFAAGATSMVVSGHKFLSTLDPCGILIYADNPHMRAGRPIQYTGYHDTTISGSRSGHDPLRLWYSLVSLGAEGHRRRAQLARATARYAAERLESIDWQATRHPHAMTVVLTDPPPIIHAKWQLSRYADHTAHIVCVPGVERDQIDEFVADLQAIRAGATELPRQSPAMPSVGAVTGIPGRLPDSPTMHMPTTA